MHKAELYVLAMSQIRFRDIFFSKKFEGSGYFHIYRGFFPLHFSRNMTSWFRAIQAASDTILQSQLG